MSSCAIRTITMTIDVGQLVLALKAKRQAEDLSLRKLSKVIGVSFSTLARIERGDGEPDNNTALRIIEWLGRDAEDVGLSFDNVALVHFRAAKNASSKTIECLLNAANILKRQYGPTSASGRKEQKNHSSAELPDKPLALSKPEMEEMANGLRDDLSIPQNKPLPALQIDIEGVEVVTPKDIAELDPKCVEYLLDHGSIEWSAMSVPIANKEVQWVVVRNDTHTMERQRVTYLEECWHILLGHKLTKVARIADAYGRTYESSEEHDAFYLASASLLPEKEMHQWVSRGKSAEDISRHFETSPELVEYRIKRLGLWRSYKGLQIQISSD